MPVFGNVDADTAERVYRDITHTPIGKAVNHLYSTACGRKAKAHAVCFNPKLVSCEQCKARQPKTLLETFS